MRLRSFLGTAATLALACVAVATPAAAATTDLTVDAPEKVVVNSTYELVTWKVSGTAAMHASGLIGLEPVKGNFALDVGLLQTGRPSGAFAIAARDVVPGKYVATAYAGSEATPTTQYTVTEDAIDIRFAGRAGLAATRSGRTVTLTGSATRFSKYNKWIATRPAMKFQKHVNSKWTDIKSVATDTKGHAVLKVTDATARSYRVYQPATSASWADYSSTVKK